MKREEQPRGKVQANLREPQLTSLQQVPRTTTSGLHAITSSRALFHG
ncbi:hypothetical protein WUBG_17507 [Wuchereria bancrofti]|uniref:Uncharacterized protein n=1 Tax=Wuchereria bancrofti TaxID=6293 RepID=J9DPX8_WUCBA|nr:hypothetical protein WUBG_17507 [Wuchereria bancrofti]